VGKRFNEGNSWPLLLAFLILIYWLSPRSWWGVLTFAFLAVFFLAWAAALLVEYFRIQYKPPSLAFSFAFAIFGLALIISALVNAPNPITDFSQLRMAARVLWGVGLPSFAVAVYMECWRVYCRLRDQI
jgi:hypothetical protein